MSRDALASVVVFLVALPLCMGIAIASGVPPAAGLLTGIVGGLLVGLLQGGPLQVSGPAAGLAVIVFELVRDRGLAGLGIVVLAAGLIQIAAGLARGGRWFRAVPPSVIYGMLAGIGVLILSSQFHVMVDDEPKASGWRNVLTIPLALWKGVVPDGDLPHHEAALTGLVTIVVLLLWNRARGRWWRMLPAPLAGVLAGTLLANLLRFPIAHVDVPANLWSAVTLPSGETLRALADPSVWAAAAGMALVASAETLLCASAVDRMHAGPRTQYNRELFAQGVGNTVCGAIGALPMTGVIVRSSANVQAGATSRRSTILHGAWILLLTALVPQILRLVPVSALAAILVYTGYKLVEPARVRQLARYGRGEVITYLVTVVAIVVTDLLHGVLLGLALAIARLLHGLSRLEISVEKEPDRRRTTLHLKGAASFLRLPDIAEVLEGIAPDQELHVRFDQLDHLDHATLELLSSWEQRHRARGGTVVIDWDALDRHYHATRRPRTPAPT